MTQKYLRFNQLSFAYETALDPLFQVVTFHLSNSWTGVVGANGAGKTTLLMLATGLLSPISGEVDTSEHVIYCPQRTDKVPINFPIFLQSEDKNANLLKGQLKIEEDWLNRWDTLSHGERKRVQLGVALWHQPDLLAIDEPTNHIDAEGRRVITTALSQFRGVGLLVSHDRYLLDGLCSQCLFIDPPQIKLRPGGITQGMAEAEIEKKAAVRELKTKKKEITRLKQELRRRERTVDKSKKRLSKRGLARHDSDARSKKDLARLTGKDGIAGREKKIMKDRVDRAMAEKAALLVQKDYVTGIWLQGSVSPRKHVLSLSASLIDLGPGKILEHPDLYLGRQDRVALTGPNGGGKSTLIRQIVEKLSVPSEHLVYIPQEIDVGRSQAILKKARSLPGEKLGFLMNVVSRLGSRPERLLETDLPSPGELRKLLLALGMVALPHIIIMDEPTNHMDLPSIQCLESALSDCTCCLLLVSHDHYFIEKTTERHWSIAQSKEMRGKFVLSTEI